VIQVLQVIARKQTRGKGMEKFRKDNSGLSLVELIIVLAIMSVLIGVASYGLSLSNGKPADECARKLASTLSHARTTTMGKYSDKIKVYFDSNNGVMVYEDILIKIEKDEGGNDKEVKSDRTSTVGSKAVTVEYKVVGGTGSTESAAGNKNGYLPLPDSGGALELRFNSGTGALTLPDKASKVVFKISKAGTVDYVIITALTGKVTVGNSENATSE
jgi:prepilin-type N-terminal cleavage/methylation domain-containing protein